MKRYRNESLVIVRKATGEVIREVDPTPNNLAAIAHLKPEFEAVPYHVYISRLQREIAEATAAGAR